MTLLFFLKYKKEAEKLKVENDLLEKKILQTEEKIKNLQDKLWYFENKAGRKKWVKDLKKKIWVLEHQVFSYSEIKDEEINCFWDMINNNEFDLDRRKLNFLEKIFAKIIFLIDKTKKLKQELIDETEKLKQELVNQTANNIILKDELNKLKKINN